MGREAVLKLLELIQQIVDDTNMPWKGKADLIRGEASEEQMTALGEFCSWFDEPD